MKFNDLDTRMRAYETSLDQTVLPEVWIVVRLDGRSFTKATKALGFEKPFDTSFHDMMSDVVNTIMSKSGINIIYGYTESDEISLLFARDEQSFNRKVRKINSVLASMAGSLATEFMCKELSEVEDPPILTFDSRVCPLPNPRSVVDYFRWRQEDSHRNCLNSYCYWMLRKSGLSKKKATKRLEGKGVAFKNELLFTEFGINFNDLPVWQRRGTGFRWTSFSHYGVNPKTGEICPTARRKLESMDLPMGDEYSLFLRSLVNRD